MRVQSMNSEKDDASTGPSRAVGKTRRSMLGGLNSLFSSKPGHMNEFRIELDKLPVHRYRAGDPVRGSVVLDVQRPMGVTHITICLWGYVQVFRHHSKAGRPTRKENGRIGIGRGRRWSSEYWGDGFASLFEEEVVLCGEGRLDPGPYHFQFELEFPHNMRLPTSIEFERGTISYLLSATITRPTGIQATTKDEKKVMFQETIDIAELPPPKPLCARLDRIDRGSRTKLKRLTSYNNGDKRKQASSTSNASKLDYLSRSMSAEVPKEEAAPPSPAAPSEDSHSSNGRLASSILSDPVSSHASQWQRVEEDSQRAPISATVQLSKPGGVAGGVVPLTISIQHTKLIRSANGIIVTLYRQSMVDMHPHLPLGPTDNREKVYEDLYPKSRSGLGGLSLSAAGSSQNWRRDISQTFCPLYIREDTMSTNIKVLVRVPEDTLPSIECAPGDMIKFKYYVEVVIDIQGKLAHQERSFLNLNMTGNQPSYAFSPAIGPLEDGNEHTVTAYYSNCIDTAPMIRSKALNLVVHTCDFVIGTDDTTKTRLAKGKARATDNGTAGASTLASNDSRRPSNPTEWNGDKNGYYHGYDGSYDYPYYAQDANYDPQYYDYHYNAYYNYGYDPNHYDYDPQAQEQYPIPDMANEEGLSEKERQRRWEERNLPSQPPPAESDDATQEATTPSAPFIPPEGDYTPTDMQLPSPGGQSAGQSASQYYPGPPVNGFATAHIGHESSQAPAYSSSSGIVTQTNGERARHDAPCDDKQELERRRLQARASAPVTDADESTSGSGSQGQTAETPTAPMLPEDENLMLQNTPGEGQAGDESLPQYER